MHHPLHGLDRLMLDRLMLDGRLDGRLGLDWRVAGLLSSMLSCLLHGDCLGSLDDSGGLRRVLNLGLWRLLHDRLGPGASEVHPSRHLGCFLDRLLLGVLIRLLRRLLERKGGMHRRAVGPALRHEVILQRHEAQEPRRSVQVQVEQGRDALLLGRHLDTRLAFQPLLRASAPHVHPPQVRRQLMIW